MSSDDIQIDPCKAAIYQLQRTGVPCDYNSVNNLCYETCSDWYGQGSNTKGTICFDKCNKCVVPFVKKRGQTTCSFRPRPPAVFGNTPALFPEIWKKTKNLEIAVKQCHDACEKTVNCNECKQKCNVDAAALVLGTEIAATTKENFAARPTPMFGVTMALILPFLFFAIYLLYLWMKK